MRVLVVHHSVSTNDYGPDDVVGLIRGFHSFHTGADKSWPDVAYNFFVDRFGRVWEGRTGSLERPVIGDATGGNQGFTQLVCLIGDFRAEPPTAEAQDAAVSLLAALADRYDIETTPSATATFVSRGSNRWPAGAPVTVPTITGHRALSSTACPGDAAAALLETEIPIRVQQVRGGTPSPDTVAEPVTTAPEPSPAETTMPSTAEEALAPTTATTPATEGDAGVATAPASEGSGGGVRSPLLAGGVLALAGIGAVIARRRRLGAGRS